jgi:hypothetical protein
MSGAIDRLLASEEPCVQYKVRVGVLGESPDSAGRGPQSLNAAIGDPIRQLQATIRDCPRVRTLLSDVGADGRISTGPYNKWRGAHWVLAQLSDLGYPLHDRAIRPLVDQAITWALSVKAVVINGRARRCASQQGYALLYMIRLGQFDQRRDELAERLIGWQWPDGGWNCDKRPGAQCSSVHETLLPFRGLEAYARLTGNREAAVAASQAAEFFLQRRLMWRASTGQPIRPSFMLLSYPYYWHYGLLAALRAMADAGRIGDPRCADALDVLESRRLSDGMFPMELKHYNPCSPAKGAPKPGTAGSLISSRTGGCLVRWGRGGKTAGNEFVTAEALTILKAAGRLAP